MSKAGDWIYCRVLEKGTYIFPRRPFWLGPVEFSPIATASTDALVALTASMQSLAIAAPSNCDPPLYLARVVIYTAPGRTAISRGESAITEAIEAMNGLVIPVIEPLELLPAGYLERLPAGSPQPILPPTCGSPFGTVASVDVSAHHPTWIVNLLLAAPHSFGEVGPAFLRSFHWSRLAMKAQTHGEQLLLNWMAIESLYAKGDSPIPKLMAIAGFPTRRLAQVYRDSASRVPNHRYWRRKFLRLVDRARRARNRIVHSGYRDEDLKAYLKPYHEEEAIRFLRLVISCLHTFALDQILTKRATLREAWESLPQDLLPAVQEQNAKWMIEQFTSD